MKTLLIVLGCVVAVGALATGVAMKVRGTLAAAQQPTVVRVEPVTEGELVELIAAPGEIQPRTKVAISAKVSATIMALPYDERMKVTKGDANGKDASVLVQLDDKDLVALYNSAKAREDAQRAQIEVSKSHLDSTISMIESQKFALDDARRDLGRQVGLLATKDVSQSTVDAAQTKVDSLKAQYDSAVHTKKSDEATLDVMAHQLDAASADVAKALQEKSYATILSPIDGVVTKRKAEVGEVAMVGTMNNAGTVILEVADLSQMMMYARVDETSIASVHAGQHAQVRLTAFPDDIFDGTVETVALWRNDDQTQQRSSNEGSTRFFEAKIKLDTKGKEIPSGLAADADIETFKHTGLRVPSQSVLGRPIETLTPEARGKPEVDPTKSIVTVVYLLVDGKAVARPVKVGPSDETHTLVLSGVKAGEQVISGPYKVLETLAEGQVVKFDAPTTRPATPTTQPATKPTTQATG